MRVTCFFVLLGLAVAARGGEVSPPALELWKEAMDYHRAKDTGRALDTFLRAYRADPAVLGLDSEGLLDRSIDYLRHQLDVKKDDLVFTFKLAEVQNLRGNLVEAIASYKKVVAINPNSPMAQRAADEAHKLEGFQQALAPVASPSPAASASVAPPPASPSPAPSADPRVADLEAKLAAAKEETAKVQEELDRLKEDHAKLQAEFDRAKYYKNLFFANPKNVELLNQGKYK